MLIYTKENGGYQSGYKFELELISDSPKTFHRYFHEGLVSTGSYSESVDKKIYREGMIKVPVENKSFSVRPSITILSSSREFQLPGFHYNVDSLKKPFLFLKDLRTQNDSFVSASVVNRGRAIPFTSELISLIIPVYGDLSGELKAFADFGKRKIKLEPELLVKQTFEIVSDSIGVRVIIKPDSGANLILIRGINNLLPEGDVNIRVDMGSDTSFFRIVQRVVWFDKPGSLRDEELSVKLIELIESKEKADSLRRFIRKSNTSPLYEYWKKFDPTPSTEYNEIMNEFYSRADEANRRFETIRGNDGALTDRGKIYIKFGEPEKIEREATPMGRMSEIWYYNKLNTIFRFIDGNGTGNYELRQ